jgi:hypothetical protein
MAKFIGVKMIEAVPMTAREANDKGHKIGNHSFEEDGYEVTYPDGYKSWSPAKEFEKAYYKLEDPAGDVLKENDIKRFIKDIENVKVGTKTTNTTLTCLTGFEVHGQAACVKPENFDLNVGTTAMAARFLIEEDFTEEYTTGRYKGMNKFEVMAIRNIPVIRSINRVLDLPNNNSYYKLDENILSIIPYKDIAKDIFE